MFKFNEFFIIFKKFRNKSQYLSLLRTLIDVKIKKLTREVFRVSRENYSEKISNNQVFVGIQNCKNKNYRSFRVVVSLEITWKEKGNEVIFLINTSNENYRTTLRKLQYPEFKDGFGRTFSKDILNLEKYFERFKEIAEEMIKQTAKEVPIPWEKALLAFLKIIETESLHWWVTGSCALTLYGVDIIPRDIDLVTDYNSALKLGKLLEDYVYEPVTDTSGWFCKWFGRAFLHMRIEWIGGVYEDESLQIQKDFGYIAEKQLRFINWNNYRIKVPPLEALLEQTVNRGLDEKAEKIREIL